MTPAMTYRIRIRTPDDPEGWTAEAAGPVGYPYGYHSAGVAVELDFEPVPWRHECATCLHVFPDADTARRHVTDKHRT